MKLIKWLICALMACFVLNEASIGSIPYDKKSCILKTTDTVFIKKKVSDDVGILLQRGTINDSTHLQYLTIREFKDRLRFYESLNSYTAVNKFGFAGAYQFSGHMIRTFGKVPRKIFLETPEIQEQAMSRACAFYIQYIYDCGYDKCIGKEMGGITITLEALMLGVHFSPLYLKNWLATYGEINGRDTNVSIGKYMSKFESKGEIQIITKIKFTYCSQ